MKLLFSLYIGFFAFAGLAAIGKADPFERLEEALTFSTRDGQARARLSGVLDIEGYQSQLPAPGVLNTDDGSILERRLSLYLDAQLGQKFYFFAQARSDHGFDPSEGRSQIRLDEAALRWTPAGTNGPTFQAGRFATIVGNWVTRHDSWSNPFITAPMPYEHLTGVWDYAVPSTSRVLLLWSHVIKGLAADREAVEKYRRLSVVWGPSYADGAAISGSVGKFDYGIEAKLGSLSSRPEAWHHGHEQRNHPTFSGRFGYRPNLAWNIGVSGSSGAYLREWIPTVAKGYSRGDYLQHVVALDVGYEWKRWQVWGEAYFCRFALPLIGNADTVSSYLEAKYKFTPRIYGALRLNHQSFGLISHLGVPTRWQEDASRVDVSEIYRFSANLQLKLQYTLQVGDSRERGTTRMLAAQATLRF